VDIKRDAVLVGTGILDILGIPVGLGILVDLGYDGFDSLSDYYGDSRVQVDKLGMMASSSVAAENIQVYEEQISRPRCDSYTRAGRKTLWLSSSRTN